ncbi:glycoside hydrolase family 88 protein [Paucibacter sp. PLA-PC-4]|uniref:beta-galactosidase BglB n=1 Tax=Paucibacter sp. PLA-PC-4 TaxID=2993655 RepID=UPI00224B2493|nr:glycoside hydrolase family 88 protein [Paucibacter sp. PLA-PC-4]MCX2865079.1 glycoside hydrolase family 88 protein [Paucibacter sp. PLA-PC-4]
MSSQQILKPIDSSKIHPLLAHHTASLGADREDYRDAINRLIHNLVNIKDEDGKFLLRLADGRVIDTKGWNGFEWTHGVGLYGIYKVWEMSGDAQAWDIMTSWFEARFAEGMPSRNINTVAPFLTLAHLFERNGERRYLPYLETWGEWVYSGLPRTEEGGFQHIVYNSVNHQQLWDDTLMMSVLPLAKIGLLLNRPHYVEEAKRQFLVHIKYLADRKTGLWFHGWTFEGRHNFANALWARGNSWVTIVIPEFIELLNLPKDDALRQFLIDTLEAQVKALAACQAPSGLWRTLLDDESSYEEAAASAGFAYGILKAVRKGYLSRDYEAVGVRAAKAVRAHINEAGELTQVSFGTPVFNSLQEYKNIPLTSMPFGQAMALLAMGEFMYRFI